MFAAMALLLFSSISSLAQAPEWTRVIPVSTYGIQEGKVICADATHVFMAGIISGPVTIASNNFSSIGERDMVLLKSSSAGIPTWIKHFDAQNSGLLNPEAILVDNLQNIYVCGTFNGTLTIGNSLTSNTFTNAFLAKFSDNGSGVWVTGYFADGTGTSKLALDNAGNCFVQSKTSKLLKVNPSGSLLWEQSYPDKTLYAIAIQGADLFVGGALQIGTTTFQSFQLTSTKDVDRAFLLRADLSGNFNKAFVEGEEINSVFVGNYHATGVFIHPTAGLRTYDLYKFLTAFQDSTVTTTVGDLGSGNLQLTINADNTISYTGSNNGGNPITAMPDSVNQYDPLSKTFTLHYQYTGGTGVRTISETLVWQNATSPAPGAGTVITDMLVDIAGNLVMTGAYASTLKLDTISIINANSSNFSFIANCDRDFSFLWLNHSSQISGSGNKYLYKTFKDNTGSLWVNGTVRISCTYGSEFLYPSTSNDQFLVQFDAAGISQNGYILTASYPGKVCVGMDGNTSITGTFSTTDPLNYGNLYLKHYVNGNIFDWDLTSSNSQTGVVDFHYVKHNLAGNTYFRGRAGGQCDYFGTMLNDPAEVTLITKLGITGNPLWTNQIHDLPMFVFGPCLVLDDQDNVFTTGVFNDTLILGTNTFVNANTANDNYIAKFNANGSLGWAVQINTETSVDIQSIVTDNNGALLISGVYSDEFSLLGNIIHTGAGVGVFIIKLDAGGNFVWSRDYPAEDYAYIAMLALDPAGNIYLTAEMYNLTGTNLQFGSVSIPNSGADGHTILVKFDQAGTPLWGNSYGSLATGTISSSWPTDIKTDLAGNVVIYGWAVDGAVFGNDTLANPFQGEYSFYLTKINSNGNILWTKAIYEKQYDFNYGDLLDLDNAGNVYIGAHFRDSLQLEGNVLGPEGTDDFLLAKFDNNGVLQWTKTIPANTTDIIHSLSVHHNDVLTVAGQAGKDPWLGPFTIFLQGGNTAILATCGALPLQIEDLKKENISVFPNPANDQIFIRSDKTWQSAEIMNSTGAIVFEQYNYSPSLDVRDLSPGMYFIRIKCGETYKMGKFIKE